MNEKIRVHPPKPDGPTIPPRQEAWDDHWNEEGWKLSRWHIAAAFLGAAVWTGIIFCAAIIYKNVIG